MRGRQFAAFLSTGSGFVVLGGLVAAVTEPLHLSLGSWLAAYLVLVCGAAQCAIGAVQDKLVTVPVSPGMFTVEFVVWNAANLAVIAGTLLGLSVLVDLGGAALLFALVLALWITRRARRGLAVWAYRASIAVMLVSIPVGLTLADLRAV
ncbi:MAG TPA: hypothetical protein VIJ76_08650 [Galbitalea sp.]